MKSWLSLTWAVLFYAVLGLSWGALQPQGAKAQDKPGGKSGAKAKPVKAKGDVGLLDLEKNYMILVTKEGKLITVDFNNKSKVTKIVPTDSKIEDVGLGSSASIEYRKEGEKKVISKIEYKPAKGGE